jgi:hypothetical protein
MSTLEYKVFDVEDTPEANIKQYFKVAHDFIIEGKQHGYVLVHWYALAPNGLTTFSALRAILELPPFVLPF